VGRCHAGWYSTIFRRRPGRGCSPRPAATGRKRTILSPSRRAFRRGEARAEADHEGGEAAAIGSLGALAVRASESTAKGSVTRSQQARAACDQCRQLRRGSYFPAFLATRWTAEKALTAVIPAALSRASRRAPRTIWCAPWAWRVPAAAKSAVSASRSTTGGVRCLGPARRGRLSLSLARPMAWQRDRIPQPCASGRRRSAVNGGRQRRRPNGPETGCRRL